MGIFRRKQKDGAATMTLPRHNTSRGLGEGRYPNFITGDFQNEISGAYWQDRYSGGTSPAEQVELYPILGTASGIHNLQVLQLMVSGIDPECYTDVTLPDGTKERLCVETERLILEPCPWDETKDFGFITAQMMAGFALEMEVFIFKHLTRGGNVEGIEVLPNCNVRREDVGGIPEFHVSGSEDYPSIVPTTYSQKEILHIIYAPALGFARGLGPQATARAAVYQALQTDLFSASYFKNALAIAGIAQVKGKTPEQIKAIELDLAAKFKGVENANRWAVINAEEMALNEMSPTPSNVSLIQAMQRAAIDIGKLLKVPPTLANESITGTLSYAVASAQEVQQTKNVLQPFAEMSARGFNRKANSPIMSWGVKMRYMLDDLLRGDERTRAEMIGKMVKNSLISINQGNRMMRLPIYEGEEFETPLKPTSWGNVDAEPPPPPMMMPPDNGGNDDDEEDDDNLSEEELSALIDARIEQILLNAQIHHFANQNGNMAL